MRGKGLELHASAKRQPGFSLTELVVALAVAMILMALAMPAFLRFYHSYQLTNAAIQVRDYLRLARYEAIRLNKPVSLQMQPYSATPGMTRLWVDSNGNGIWDPTEMTTLLGSSGNLVDSGSVPGTSALIAAASLGSFATNAPSPTSSQIPFDARGAVIPPTNVNMFYLASSVAPEAGFRAVLLLPAGSIQIWAANGAGNWQTIQ
jgi:prepilin-type N-terminal cleavage/methylation domain-containing protein